MSKGRVKDGWPGLCDPCPTPDCLMYGCWMPPEGATLGKILGSVPIIKPKEDKGDDMSTRTVREVLGPELFRQAYGGPAEGEPKPKEGEERKP